MITTSSPVGDKSRLVSIASAFLDLPGIDNEAVSKMKCTIKEIIEKKSAQENKQGASSDQENKTRIELDCIQLEKLTRRPWIFNGVHYISQRDDRNFDSVYPEALLNLLMARGILSKVCKWKLNGTLKVENVLNSEIFHALDSRKLADEIKEAGALLCEITGYNCRDYLDIFQLKDGRDIAVLEKIGCITVKEYFAFNVPIQNYDIEKLRLLNDKKISLKTIWERYNAADKTKALFSQIIEKSCEPQLENKSVPTKPEATQSTKAEVSLAEKPKQHSVVHGFFAGTQNSSLEEKQQTQGQQKKIVYNIFI